MEEVKQNKRTPAVLAQLKQENEALRAQLRELSADLDKVLAKQSKKGANPAEGNCHSVRELKLKSARAQAQQYEKEVAALRHQLETSSADRAQELEQEVAQLTQQIRTSENANRSLTKQQKDREDSLEALSEGSARAREIQRLNEQLKGRKAKVDKLEASVLHEEEACKQAREKILQLEAKTKDLPGFVTQDDEEPAKLPVGQEDLQTIKVKVEELERKKEADLAEWKKTIADSETALTETLERKSKVQSEYDPREQLNRILESKVKELKRLVHIFQRKNESLSKATAPDMGIDPVSVAQAGKEEHKSLRKSQEVHHSKPDLGY